MKILKHIAILCIALFLALSIYAREVSRPDESADPAAKKENVPKAKPEKKPEPKASKVVRRGKTTTKRSSSRRRSSSYSAPKSKRSGYISSFNVKPDLDIVVLYFKPLDIRKKVDEEFLTAVKIMNRSARPFDRIHLAIDYDKDYIEPLGFNDEWLRSIAVPPVNAHVFRDRGIIVYSAVFKEPVSVTDRTLLLIKWHTLKAVDHSEIEFVSIDNVQTFLASGSVDILGKSENPRDGVIPASVRITSSEAEEDMPMPSDSTFSGYIEGGNMRFPKFDYGIRLKLVPEKTVVRANEIFYIHLLLENNNNIPADNINLALEYDPETIEILDYDDGNWITRGINIFDGLYHEEFPFDYQIKNSVHPRNGAILYKMASSDPQVLARSGTIATIKARALVSGRTTRVQFRMPRDQDRNDTTQVTFMRRDVLGTPDTKKDGVDNCTLVVQ